MFSCILILEKLKPKQGSRKCYLYLRERSKILKWAKSVPTVRKFPQTSRRQGFPSASENTSSCLTVPWEGEWEQQLKKKVNLGQGDFPFISHRDRSRLHRHYVGKSPSINTQARATCLKCHTQQRQKKVYNGGGGGSLLSGAFHCSQCWQCTLSSIGWSFYEAYVLLSKTISTVSTISSILPRSQNFRGIFPSP